MQIVGVDFGTSNVRIATRDDKSQLTPRSINIGRGRGAATMPAVIAFQRDAPPLIGEAADERADNADTVVVRNIKRWALTSDPYVDLHLKEISKVATPDWWNAETRCVETPWGASFPVWDVIRQILAEAFRQARLAGLDGEFKWRAGCPVQAGLEYRSELARTLSEFGGENKVTSVVEEPVLFLALAHQLGKLARGGSYLVYDLGGGSFDVALAEVSADGRMTVYAAHSNPLLGGTVIDELLAQRLEYTGPQHLLRIAKEALDPVRNPEQAIGEIGSDTTLTWDDLVAVMRRHLFLEKTHAVMREAYISARVVWKYDADAPTLGYSALPSCRPKQLPAAFAKDLNAVILCGGPSKSPYIRAQMKEFFGDSLVVNAEDLIPSEIPDPELTGLSIGACYSAADYNPTYIRRLPARISLIDAATGDRQEYEPYQHFSGQNVFDPEVPFISPPLPREMDRNARYELVVTGLDHEIYANKVVDFDREEMPLLALPRSLHLVIDRFGRVGIQAAGRQRNASDNEAATDRWIEIESPPWQTDWQFESSQALKAYESHVWGKDHYAGISLANWQDVSNRGIGGRVSD